MPNYCEYNAHLRGKRDSVKKLIDWLQAHYDYSEGQKKVWKGSENNPEPVEHHIGFRVFNCEVINPEILENKNNEEIVANVYGDVAWSIMSTMFDGPWSYLGDSKRNNEHTFSISLPEACKELKIDVEIFSQESGECFAEHYYVDQNGSLLISEDTNYDIVFISDYETYEDFVKDYDHKITKENFDQAQKEGAEYLEFYGNYPSGIKQFEFKF